MPAPHGLRFSNSFICAELFNPSLNAIEAITRSEFSSFFRHSLLLSLRCEAGLSSVLAMTTVVLAALSIKMSAVSSAAPGIALRVALAVTDFLVKIVCINESVNTNKKCPLNKAGILS